MENSNVVNISDLPVDDFSEIGATGIKRFGGVLYEDFLPYLNGPRAIAIYKEMSLNDPVCFGVKTSMRMLCRRVNWRIQPASQSRADVDRADFIEECMHDMSSPWGDVVDQALTMLEFGFSISETVYKRRNGKSNTPGTASSKYNDGKIGWRKMAPRSQDTLFRWVFDDSGGLVGFEQQAPPLNQVTFIPIEKCLLFRTSVQKNSPEGLSIFRGAYNSWYMKKHIQNIESIGIERDLAGLPVITCPSELLGEGATVQQKSIYRNLKNIIVNVRRDSKEGVIMPSAYNKDGKELYSFKLVSTAGHRQFNTSEIIQRYDQRIAMTSLADFLLLGSQNVGSFAMASSKTGLFSAAIGSFLDMIADVFNRYAIPRLLELNGDTSTTGHPQLMHGDIEDVDLAQLGTYIANLSKAGFPLFPNSELESYLMKVARLPETQKDEGSDDLTDSDPLMSPLGVLRNFTSPLNGTPVAVTDAPESGSSPANAKPMNPVASHTSPVTDRSTEPLGHEQPSHTTPIGNA